MPSPIRPITDGSGITSEVVPFKTRSSPPILAIRVVPAEPLATPPLIDTAPHSQKRNTTALVVVKSGKSNTLLSEDGAAFAIVKSLWNVNVVPPSSE